MLVSWSLAIAIWRSSGCLQPLILFGYIGTSLGMGLGPYAVLPKRKKGLGRRLALFLVGTCLFGFAAIPGAENAQIDGFLRMTTEAQINANRENAKSSTGPQAPTGKARSARNPLKHGLRAQIILDRQPFLPRKPPSPSPPSCTTSSGAAPPPTS